MERINWPIVLVALPAAAAAVIALTSGVTSVRRELRLIRFAPPTGTAENDLKQLDSYSEQALRARLSQLYSKVARAWSEHRLVDLEPDVKLDLLAAWTAKPPTAPAPLALPRIRAVRAQVVEAEVSSLYEHLVISIDGGERHGVPLLQYWTLERGRSGAIHGQTCPACSSPLVLDERGRCVDCGATIDLGRLVWILARVESAREWSKRQLDPTQNALSALDAIAASDPAFDPDTFAERVASLYPHLAQAIRDPSTPLGQVAIAPDLRRVLEAREAARRALGRRAVEDSVTLTGVSIQSVDLRAGRFFITVHVSGSAARYELDDAGHNVAGVRRPGPMLERWTFSRLVDLTTTGHGGILAELCPVCGAPIELDEHGRCRHCAEEVTLGSRDWVLSDVSHLPDV